MKTKKLYIIMILIIIFSLMIGCVKQGDPVKPATTKDLEKNEKDIVEDELPTLLTFGATQQFQTTPIEWNETEIFSKLFKMANVEIDYYYYTRDNFKILLASQDLPDFAYSQAKDTLDSIVSSKLALDMWPLLEKYAPNMLNRVYEERNELVREFKGGDNKALYFIAPAIGRHLTRGGYHSPRGYSVRWDYYKELGCPEITDDDAYIDILAAMVKNHPQTPQGKKTYAIGLSESFTNWRTRAAFTKQSLLSTFIADSGEYMSGYDDMEPCNGYTNTERSAYWIDMKFYNKLYKLGLLDPDSFTQTGDEANAKLKAGQYMAQVPSTGDTLYNEMRKEDENTLAGHITIPSLNTMSYSDTINLTGDFPGCYIFISAKSKNWEAVLRLWDLFHDLDVQRMIWSGIEGEHWDYINGVPTLRDNTIEMFQKSSNEAREIGFTSLLLTYPFELIRNSFVHPDGFPLYLMDTDEMRALGMHNLRKDFCEYYNCTYQGEPFHKLVQEGKIINASGDYQRLVKLQMGDTPSDIRRIIEKCDNILYRAIPNLVMAKTDEEFQAIQTQVFSDLKNVDEPTAWEWWSSNFNKAKPIVKPLFDKAEF
jgi:putative aldouronate transport system substrate-binding protein